MRTMPTSRANLENKRFIFFEIGIIVALSTILFSFNLRTLEKHKINLDFSKSLSEQEEMVAITQQEKPPPPPTPPQQTSIITIVDNATENVEEDLVINAEADQDSKVEEYIPYTPPEIEEEDHVDEETIFVVVESMPSFPGGDEARIKYLNENINYPSIAREAGIQGTVYVTFVVEKDGSITDVRILRGIGGGCDEEAVRVIQNMPNWIPGKQRNVPVRVQFNMPIRFILL
jgi:protein TonB